MIRRVGPWMIALALACLTPGTLAAQPAAPAASAVRACPAPDRYLTPKVPLRRAAEAVRKGKRLRVLVFAAVRMPAITETVEAKRYPASLAAALSQRLPGVDVTVTTRMEPRAGAGESLPLLNAALSAPVAPSGYDLVIWQLGSTDVLKGTDMSAFGTKLSSGVQAIHARQADAIVITMQYSPRTDFMFDAGPYLQALRWTVKSDGAALFNRYDIMRYWAEEGTFDLSDLQPGASMFEDVHRCVGDLLARFITNGMAAPETQ